MGNDFLPYLNSDVVVLQNSGKDELEFFKKLKNKQMSRIIYDVDEILDDEYSLELMSLCDEISVSTPFLKNHYQKLAKNISVVPNKIPFVWAGGIYSEQIILRNYRKHKNRPRIICLNNDNYNEDLCRVIKDSKDEFCWIFIGKCPEGLEGKVKVVAEPTLGIRPQFLLSLEANMMVAPLKDTLQNHAKSNRELLEAGALGLPIATQDMTPYKEASIQFSSAIEMIKKVKAVLSDEKIFLQESKASRNFIDRNWLEQEENILNYRNLCNYIYE
ncbi:MAG: hypothetical protein S4CHLAM20_10090 [Chlamydiia bacterium]|nr:hypothetical protein [Chlamydiia bacterium]